MKYKNESGRSILEMTAVLAIMGILSIGSFAAYRMAMVSIRTNTLLSEAEKRAVAIASQLNQGHEVSADSLSEFGNNVISGGMKFVGIETDAYIGQFGLVVTGIPYKVCQNLLASTQQNNSLLRAIAEYSEGVRVDVAITDCVEPTDENDTWDYVLIYNEDLAKGAYEQACTAGVKTVTMCNGSTRKCCSDDPNCRNQSEMPGVVCCKANEAEGASCNGGQGTCQNRICMLTFQGVDNKSYNCDESADITATRDECNKCFHRAWIQEDNTCKLCGQNEYVKTTSTTDACKDCDSHVAESSTTTKQCNSCNTLTLTRRHKEGSYCVPEKCDAQRFRNYVGSCIDCNNTTKNTAKASYRVLDANGGNPVDTTTCTSKCGDTHQVGLDTTTGYHFCRKK
ncbi:MAG: type II secretion system protein [Alphaproteobacteria bacterium]|nr:type II secretion system protein [Alphaproteobacteria bacterium]